MALEDVSQVLTQFDEIHLEEMDEVKLMNRTDTKFVFSLEQFESFLPEMIEDYRVLNVKEQGVYDVRVKGSS